MSVYLLVGIFLCVLPFLGYFSKRCEKIGYWIGIAVLYLFALFRFGQGTDYIEYCWYYVVAGRYDSLSAFLSTAEVHSEAGWRLILYVFSHLHVPFDFFMGIFTTVEILCLDRLIRHHCKYRTFALFLAYPTLYLTYMISILRQGLTVLFFLSFMLDWLFEKRLIRYYIACLLLSLIHTASLLLILIPIITHIIQSFKHCFFFIVITWLFGFLLYSGVLDGILTKILPSGILFYIQSGKDVSWFAAAERLLTYALLFLYAREEWRNGSRYGSVTFQLFQIYTLGMLIYGLFMWAPSVASRLSYFCKATEIILLCQIIYKEAPRRSAHVKLTILYICFLCIIMYWKNINSYIDQGSYYPMVNSWNYPYITVFNKEQIGYYRPLAYAFDYEHLY